MIDQFMPFGLFTGAKVLNPVPDPTEPAKLDRAAIARNVRDLLVLLRQDPDSAGLKETPRRVADAWAEFIDYDPGSLGTTFEAVSVDQLVVVKGMRLWSCCEHHLLPFWCDVSIGYIARSHVLGLSKFGRIAQRHAHKLQLQERLVRDIASEVAERAQTPDVAVLASGEHGCMVMRGARMPHRMISSDLRGAFRDQPALRAEFMSLAGG